MFVACFLFVDSCGVSFDVWFCLSLFALFICVFSSLIGGLIAFCLDYD